MNRALAFFAVFRDVRLGLCGRSRAWIRSLRQASAAVLLAAALPGAPLFAERAAPAGDVVLQDGAVLVAFDSHSGALTRLESRTTGWTIERRPDLAVSFRLHAPLPDRRDNFVLGRRQRAAAVEKLSDRQIRLRWRDLESEHGGVLPITFTATVTLTGGRLSFEGELQNDSHLAVESVDYPYLGDLEPPAREATMHARTMWYGNLDSDELYPHFDNRKGYWGVLYPARRRRYRSWIWDGTFRDTLGASVRADGTASYSVFVAASGKRAVVVANQDAGKAITATVELPNAGPLLAASPEEPEARPATGTMKIPARSAVVLMER